MIKSIFPEWLTQGNGTEFIFGIPRGHFILSVFIFLLTCGLVLVVHLFLKRKKVTAGSVSSGTTAASPATIRMILEAIRPPVLLVIWIWGLFGVVQLLLARWEANPDWSWIFPTLSSARLIGHYVALFWGLFRLVTVLESRLTVLTARTTSKWDDILARVAVRAVRLVLPLVGCLIIIPTLELPASSHDLLKQGASLLLIGGVGFILYELTITAEKAVLDEFRIDAKDNLEGRKIQTEVRMLKRIGVTMIILFTIAMMLMVFEPVRHLGKSMLASAGVAGIIVGFAAQRSLATLVAGVQIAFTQPIRIDDVVIVEGEWGRIEEITMFYVVVIIWDLRRMIVPITYFIEKPFQNWTRVNADLLGTVMLYVDYATPVNALRAELDRILEKSPLWDRKVKALQVTEAKQQSLELRVLVSAANASDAFDLRCNVREALVNFLQREHPEALPRTRSLNVTNDHAGSPAPIAQFATSKNNTK